MNNVFRQAATNLMIPADTDLLSCADLAFVFGNREIAPELAARAVKLYRDGQVDNILVTGGVKTRSGLTEAEAIYKDLKQAGVPSRHILVENESRNTEENIVLGKKIVDDALGLENIATVISVGHAAAGPRFTMTLSRRWPSVLPMHVSVFPDIVDPEYWWENKAFFKKAFNDGAKLPLYGHLDYISPVLPDHVNELISQRSDLGNRAPALKAS